MTGNLWTNIREYIAAEIQLALGRSHSVHMKPMTIQKLEEQSTRMETAIREEVTKLEEKARNLDLAVNAARAEASKANSHFTRY